MSGECLEEGIEHLHRGFLGRETVLAELDRCLLDDGVDRVVVLTGGPGMGKTAILARWLARREAAHELVPHHFVRRQQCDRIEPSTVVRSLAARIEQRYPAQRDPYARPEARLAELLARVSARELTTPGARMMLVIDGLDDSPPASALRQVLALLPATLPRGIRLLCAGRQTSAERERLDDRHGRLVHLDLEDPSLADDNDVTVQSFWRREAPRLGLDDRSVEHAVRCADGNMLHATLLRLHLASVPPSQRRLESTPRGLPSLLALLWQRVAGDPAAVRTLGILCAAREPLSLEHIGRLAGSTDLADQRGAIHVARALVAETRRADNTTVYRLFHDAVRSFLVERIGPVSIRDHHQALADKLATWPSPRDAAARRYALQYAIGHRIAAGDCRAIHALASNLDFVEAKCSALGVDEVELEIRRAAEACLAGHLALARELDDLVREIARESVALRDDARAAEVWNRLRRIKPRASEIEPRAPSPAVGSPPVARPMPSSSRPVVVRELIGRGGAVTACAVTIDGHRVVSACSDHSLKIWDLHSGRLLNTLTGHTGVVASCAVTSDGRRLVSASADTTLKVWDLDTGRVIVTLEGHTSTVESCAIIPDGRRVVSASADCTLRIWDLDTGHVITALEDHTEAVTDCAVTPDGRHIISASADTTLKVWALDTGHVITTLAGHAQEVTSCAVTPDGRRVVSGSGDHTLKVWDVDTGHVITTLAGHTGWVESCAVAPDGRRLYSTSLDSTVKIWALDTGRAIATLDDHAGPVTCCAVTPDGSRLISGSSDHTLKVWDLDGSTGSTLQAPPRPLPGTRESSRGPAELTVRKPLAAKHNIILFLAANPKNTSRIDLEEECAAIERELQMARHGNDFEFRSKWAVSVDEMARHLIDLEPTIVHFSGHGKRDTPTSGGAGSRDVRIPGDSGIYLHDEQHGVQLVTGRALALMVESSAPTARVVVLNACYSDGHAEALCRVVDCVVGMTREIHDHAARSFAVAFYRALGNRRSVGNAVDHARATLAAKHLPDESVPRCRTHNWADAHEIHL